MNNFSKGDIIYGRRKSDAIHPIIYLADKDSFFFYGAMITHSSQNENILMKPEHFFEYNENHKKFEVQFHNSSIVNCTLLKKNEWFPFRLVGRLTDLGIEFVEFHLKLETAITWEEYLLNNNQTN